LTANSLAETHISPDDIPLVERDDDDDGRPLYVQLTIFFSY